MAGVIFTRARKATVTALGVAASVLWARRGDGITAAEFGEAAAAAFTMWQATYWTKNG
jgi:hypothetical protein